MARHSFVCAALALVTLLCSCAEKKSAGQPKNLLFVVFDTTRSDHLGCYGYAAKQTSPTVDALAADGLLLENVYSQSSLTPVSAGSFLSGCYPFRHGIRSLFVVGEETLSEQVPTLAELMSNSGRKTAGFVSAIPMGKKYGLARGFDVYNDDLSATRERFGVKQFSDAPQRPAEETTDLALEWLADNGEDPFFAMVHYFDAHDPSFVPPRKFLREHLSFELPTRGRLSDYSAFGNNMQQLVELYDAEILYMDRQLARILDRLDELGVRDETLVVFLADHGESFGEHGYFTHGWLAEEQIRVPLIFSGPGVPKNVKHASRLRSVDLLPTLAEMFDLPLRREIDGESALALMNGTEAPVTRDVYSEVHHAPNDPRGREAEMLTRIEGDWKYIHRADSGQHELYNLKADPGEANNLRDSQPDKAAELLGQLITDKAFYSGVNLEGLSEEERAALAKLGYLGSGDSEDQ